MAVEKTFTIIKPESVAKGNIGNILAMLENAGFGVLAMKKIHMSNAVAQEFYAEHKERPFFPSLMEYITGGPVVVAVLEKENAVADLRALMGATNPAEAADGTIRKLYGANIQNNAIHGSANPQDAAREVAFFFGSSEFIK